MLDLNAMSFSYRQQRPTKRRHVQSILDETGPLKIYAMARIDFIRIVQILRSAFSCCNLRIWHFPSALNSVSAVQKCCCSVCIY